MMKKMMMVSALAVFVLTSMTAPAPKSFKLDVAKSTFKWTGKKVAGSHWGYVKFLDGSLQVSKGALVGGTFNVDMTSIDCQDLQGEWQQKLIGHLKNDDFFATDKFPKSILVIKSAKYEGNDQYNVVADLTIKGATHEVSFPATVRITDMEVTAKANFNVNRTLYGIKYGSGSFFSNLGDKTIDDNFNVEVDLTAVVAVPVKAKSKSKSKKSS